MQSQIKSLRWPIVLSLTAVAVVIGSLNLVGKTYLVFATDVLNVIIIVPFVVFSLILAVRNGFRGNFGKAGICFAIFAIAWSMGEVIWAIDELVLNKKPFPSEADYFYMLGYPAYMVFAVLYIRPFRSSISAKTIALAVGISAILMGSLVYYAITNSDLPQFETILLAAYPVGDAICLIPTIVGLSLFFRGQVNFTWLLLLVGMISFVVADSAYQIISQTSEYDTGNPIDIVYLWAYVFFLFGAYYHLQVFRARNAKDRFNDQESLR